MGLTVIRNFSSSTYAEISTYVLPSLRPARNTITHPVVSSLAAITSSIWRASRRRRRGVHGRPSAMVRCCRRRKPVLCFGGLPSAAARRRSRYCVLRACSNSVVAAVAFELPDFTKIPLGFRPAPFHSHKPQATRSSPTAPRRLR